MITSKISIEIIDLLIDIRNRIVDFESEKSVIDVYLNNYEKACMKDKKRLVDNLISSFSSISLTEKAIAGEVLHDISECCFLLKGYRENLTKVDQIGQNEFIYNGKKYSIDSDVNNWVMGNDRIVVTILENGKETEDNLIALDFQGNVMWNSQKCIDCPDRMGALFLPLSVVDENTILAPTYAGITYYIDITTGKVKNAILTK